MTAKEEPRRIANLNVRRLLEVEMMMCENR